MLMEQLALSPIPKLFFPSPWVLPPQLLLLIMALGESTMASAASPAPRSCLKRVYSNRCLCLCIRVTPNNIWPSQRRKLDWNLGQLDDLPMKKAKQRNLHLELPWIAPQKDMDRKSGQRAMTPKLEEMPRGKIQLTELTPAFIRIPRTSLSSLCPRFTSYGGGGGGGSISRGS